MSLTAAEYSQRRKAESQFYHKLVNLHPLERETLQWMAEHNKHYSAETLNKFNVQQGMLQRYDKETGFGARGFVCADPVIVIPVGPIFRCYRYLEPDKRERWHVAPAGHGPQWLGDLSASELIITEGEWDFLKLRDLGFRNAVTQTAGAGTFLRRWAPLFTNKNVFVCYDRDQRGQEGAAKVARNIFSVARAVRLVDLPLQGTPDANDISDFFEGGGRVDEFERILRSARPYIPANRISRRGSGRDGRRFHGNGTRLVGQ